MFFKKHLFSADEKDRIVEAIRLAELNTSGEIRVHTEPKCAEADVLKRAWDVFGMLKMHETSLRNAVLIYLAYEDRRFAIIGDKGINELVPADFWDKTKEQMQDHFKQGRFLQGVIEGVSESGKHLKAYFPYQSDDKNELSNEISEG